MTSLFNAMEFLYSLKELDREIKSKLDTLEEIRSMATSVSVATDKEAVQTSTSGDKLPKLVAKIIDLENEINREIDGLVDRRKVAKEIIFEIKSENRQNVLYDYFICDIPLWKIAEVYEITYENAKKRLDRGKDDFEKIFNAKRRTKTQYIAPKE